MVLLGFGGQGKVHEAQAQRGFSPTALPLPEMPEIWLAQVVSIPGPQNSTAMSPPSSLSSLLVSKSLCPARHRSR